MPIPVMSINSVMKIKISAELRFSAIKGIIIAQKYANNQDKGTCAEAYVPLSVDSICHLPFKEDMRS